MSFWQAVKAKLFPAAGGMPGYGTFGGDWVRFQGTGYGANIDYGAMAGDLHKNGVVMACIAWMQRAFAEAPLTVVALDGKEENPVEGHPLVQLLDRPNPFTTGDQFWQGILWDLTLCGNAYAVKVRSGSGATLQLWHIPRYRITPQWTGSDFITNYRMMVEGVETILKVEDVVHFKVGKDPANERLGYSPWASCLREITILNNAVNYRSDILRNGAVGSHFVTPKERGAMTPEQATAMETKWLNKLTGVGRGRPLFSSLPADVHKLDYSPADLDLGQMTDEQTNLVCSAWGIPTMVLGLTAGEAQRTYSNWQEAKRAALTGVIVPLWKLVAETLTYDLLRPDFGGGENERCCFDTSQVEALQEDANAVWQRYVTAWEKGAITRAGLKVALGMDADEATDNVYLVPTSATLVDATETPEDRAKAEEEQQAMQQQANADRLEALRGAQPESSGDAQAASGAAKALPLPEQVRITRGDVRDAIVLWDETMPEAEGILAAKPTNGKR